MADYQDLINRISQGNAFVGDNLAILNAHYGELQAGLEAILSAITSLNRGDRCTSSLEVGALAEGRLKFYFDPNDLTEAEGLMRNALSIRAMTLKELAKQEVKP